MFSEYNANIENPYEAFRTPANFILYLKKKILIFKNLI